MDERQGPRHNRLAIKLRYQLKHLWYPDIGVEYPLRPQWAPRETAWWSKAPKLESNLTAQEWKIWRLMWTRYKRYARLTDKHLCMYNLWCCFSPELNTGDSTEGLGNDDANLTEEQVIHPDVPTPRCLLQGAYIEVHTSRSASHGGLYCEMPTPRCLLRGLLHPGASTSGCLRPGAYSKGPTLRGLLQGMHRAEATAPRCLIQGKCSKTPTSWILTHRYSVQGYPL